MYQSLHACVPGGLKKSVSSLARSNLRTNALFTLTARSRQPVRSKTFMNCARSHSKLLTYKVPKKVFFNPLKCALQLPEIDPRIANCNAWHNLPQVTHVLHFTFANRLSKKNHRQLSISRTWQSRVSDSLLS